MAPLAEPAMPASPRPRGNTQRRLSGGLLVLLMVLTVATGPAGAVLGAAAAAGTAGARRKKAGFAADESGNTDVSKSITTVIGAIVGVLVGIIAVTVGVGILAGQLPGFFGSVGNITTAFTSADLGNTQLNTIVHSFAIIIGLLLILAPFGLIGGLVALAVVHRGGGKSSS